MKKTIIYSLAIMMLLNILIPQSFAQYDIANTPPPGPRKVSAVAVTYKATALRESASVNSKRISKTEKGALYYVIEADGDWAYITTGLLGEFKSVDGWIDTKNLHMLDTANAQSKGKGDFPNNYSFLNKNIKLLQLPSGNKKWKQLYSGTKVGYWGDYNDWSYVTVWFEGGERSGFVKSEYLSNIPIYDVAEVTIYDTIVDDIIIYLGPGTSYPTLFETQTYPHALDHLKNGGVLSEVDTVGKWSKIVMEDGSVGFVYSKYLSRQ